MDLMLPEPATPAASPLLWDIVDEHLDEAAFLAEHWEQALSSSLYDLAELARGPEERLLAHLDALTLGGRQVAERRLRPALQQQDEPRLAQAAAMALLLLDDVDYSRAVGEAIVNAETDDVRAGLCRAAQLIRSDVLLDALQACSQRLERPELRAAAVHTLGFWERDLGPHLAPLLTESDSGLRAAALYAAGRSRRTDCQLQVRLGLSSEQPQIREAALDAATRLGMKDLLEALRGQVHSATPSAAAAMVMLSLLGSAPDHTQLLELARCGRTQDAAIFALGFSGSLTIVDSLIELARIEKIAALAGEALCAILGIDLEREHLLARTKRAAAETSEQLDLDTDLHDSSESELPLPDPEVLASWWRTRRKSMDATSHYIHGIPYQKLDPPVLLRALDRAPMRRRHALALALAFVTEGKMQLQTRGLSARQRDEQNQGSRR